MKEKLDQYYTPFELALNEISEVVDYYGIDNLFLEPAGGTGVFIEALLLCGVPKEHIVAYDLDPKHSLVERQDFLKLKELPNPKNLKIISIGNFPFGKGGALSIKFMNQSVKLGASVIAVINPYSVGNKLFSRGNIHENLHPMVQHELPDGLHFTTEKGEYLEEANPVRCAFQVWELKTEKRYTVKRLYETEDFSLLQIGCDKYVDENGRSREKTMEERGVEADFTIVSHGKKAGTVMDFNAAKQKANVCQFVKVKDNKDVDEVRKKIEESDFSYFYNSATIKHNPSLSPSEMVYSYNEDDSVQLQWRSTYGIEE